MKNAVVTTWVSVPPNVTIVAVTKTFPVDAVLTAYHMGLRHIGENRVEEAADKIEHTSKQGITGIHWHMIGHVQSRKARAVVSAFDSVDSVDSQSLLQRLNKEASVIGKRLPVLLEVNISGEKGKYGFPMVQWESDEAKLRALLAVIREGITLSHIRLDGLMTMAPLTQNAGKNRPYFQSMRALLHTIREQVPQFGSTLSMGTSGDYQVAIEEGATQVRLGEALFGKRAR